ncbi:group I intron-associated PD-(D/E)XK endonuclease [Bradyrhizobium sp. Ai1a-2]|uniref:group I intron-associated PD-(D/E)XK endonuclease n=1 Tax=Bradyrhizobium sp. Ai1a-2 TaxID=196490 RepID=UPI000483AB57|nr:group I intron-associated PD-(D/E)XK endonuclease [Bradyrhizobium sp. Ai1a-2]
MIINIDHLKRLAADPSHALELGKAAEHIVCADLILKGYRCYLSDQGLPYDLVVDLKIRLIRVQVKACCFARGRNAGRKELRFAYSWSIRQRGRGRKGARLSAEHCDVVALVALDIGVTAYLPLELCGQGLRLEPPGSPLSASFTSGSRWARNVDQFPFEEAIGGDLSSYKASRGAHTHCIHGHELTADNIYVDARGNRLCRKCISARSKSYLERKRAKGAQE